MFHSISWQSYWTTLALCLAIYYLVIFLVYYRKDLIGRVVVSLRRSPVETITQSDERSFDGNDAFRTPAEGSDEAVVYACMDELNAFFEEAKKRKWHNREMIAALRMIMKKYPAIKASGYKQSVTNVLYNQCAHVCGMTLTNEELDAVW